MYQKGINVRQKYKSEWNAWNNAKRRCHYKKHPMYKYYGLRGILMSDSWRKNFMNFLKDMGTKSEDSLTLDRIDNNLGYFKENCRWVTMKVQCKNRRKRFLYSRVNNNNIRKITVNGITKTLKDWSVFFGYKYKYSIYCYKLRNNLSFEDAIERLYNKKYELH